ncbi:GTP-binding protein [Desulfitispora alkaliphila]|uniref:ribosome biogenesis GTPase Der n=1 Tax=Desulfitispora alkaliphila TaxID=622674 RepID=UPI003D1A4CDA
MAKPIIAIVGRPNVGKSTLFNRITGGRVAIVDDKPGITRDRLYRNATWLDRSFTVVDTGGIEYKSDNAFMGNVKKQAGLAIEEAEVIIFVVDGQTGKTSEDEEVAAMLRRSRKPVILAVNKIEDKKHEELLYDFYQLALGEPVAISATHGLNIGDLLDQAIAHMPSEQEEDIDPDTIKIAVIGKPNVGKSSLVNRLLGEERVIVSNIPGTTRDAIDTEFEVDGQKYLLIDTAGMRRKAKIDDVTERYSVIRSIKAIDRSDVVLMVIDASEGVTEQDKKVAGYAHEAGRAAVIIVNKWDLIEKEGNTMNRFDEHIREELGFMKYAPILYISALTGQRVTKISELVNFVAEQHSYRVNTSVLNNLIRDITHITPPPTDKGRRLKILFCTQASTNPPKFIIFVNDPELMHFSYQRYIENNIREHFGFQGTPIRFAIRKRKE